MLQSSSNRYQLYSKALSQTELRTPPLELWNHSELNQHSEPFPHAEKRCQRMLDRAHFYSKLGVTEAGNAHECSVNKSVGES